MITSCRYGIDRSELSLRLPTMTSQRRESIMSTAAADRASHRKPRCRSDDSERVPTQGTAEMIGPEALHAIGSCFGPPLNTGSAPSSPTGRLKVSHPRQASVGGVSASFRRAVECVRLAHRGGGRVEATRRTWRAGGELLCRARSEAGVVHPAVDRPCCRWLRSGLGMLRSSGGVIPPRQLALRSRPAGNALAGTSPVDTVEGTDTGEFLDDHTHVRQSS